MSIVSTMTTITLPDSVSTLVMWGILSAIVLFVYDAFHILKTGWNLRKKETRKLVKKSDIYIIPLMVFVMYIMVDTFYDAWPYVDIFMK
ncbi:hypothetical protein [Salmonella phage SSBI34]|nr:hypothetical protein [Salmonella phage SSBI34]